MSEFVAIICRIDRTYCYRNEQRMVKLLPIGEKERGEKPDEMPAEKLQQRNPLYQEK